ncbi:MAG: DUF5666 domain-containing protein, partial [Gammaproteobacteria bacterium]
MVRGPVENLSVIDVDTQTATMSVLGQAVETNDLTAFRDVDLETLRDGDVVEISGVRDAEGEIVPSFFGSPRNRREFRVIGRVSQFDDVTTTFAVSGLTVDFGGTTVTGLGNGALVEVVGASSGFASPRLTADTVTRLVGLNVRAGATVELEGIVTDPTSTPARFVIGDEIVVTTTASTAFEDGEPGDIAVDARLEVEGTIDTDGVLQASKIGIRQFSDVRITAQVDNVDAGAGVLTVLGVTFQADLSTKFEDQSGDEGAFGLTSIAAGDYLEVTGFVEEGGSATATRVVRDELNDTVELRAPVEAFDKDLGTITLLGILVSSDQDMTSFEINDDETLTPEQFFNAVTIGSDVKVRWDPFEGTADFADEIEFEADANDDVDG